MRFPRLHRKRFFIGLVVLALIEGTAFWMSRTDSSAFFRMEVPARPEVESVKLVPQFDAFLGWKTPYRTPLGQRPSSELGTPWLSVFGGSLVHADGVEASKAWSARLSRKMGRNVANFGVTGYSPDQALLRAQVDIRKSGADIAGLGISSSDIDGILSVYRRFQDPKAPPFAKPRFYSLNGSIMAFSNPIALPSELTRLSDPAFLARLGKYDWWYNPSRLPVASFPYSRAFLNPRFWMPESRRTQDSESLWSDEEARAIFLWIVDHFVREARQRDAAHLVMLMPARHDVEARLRGDYSNGYYFLLSHCSVRRYRCFDAVQAFSWKVESGVEIDSLYSGDVLSEEGNRLFGDSLGEYLTADAALGLNG